MGHKFIPFHFVDALIFFHYYPFMKKIIVGVAFVLGMGITAQSAKADCSDQQLRELVAQEFNRVQENNSSYCGEYATTANQVSLESTKSRNHVEEGIHTHSVVFKLNSSKTHIRKDECPYSALRQGSATITDCNSVSDFKLN